MQVRHAQLFGLGLDLALVPDIWLCKFVFEKAFVVVPRLFGRAFGQASEIFGVLNRFFAAALRDFREQREIEALDRLAALGRQLGANAALFFETRNLMAAGTPEMLNPAFAFVF